jgi:twinkle protein
MATDDLSSLLAGAGIRLKSMRPGQASKVPCPRCGGGKTGETSLSVRIDDDGAGATWQCHRGNCGWKDGGRVRSYKPAGPISEPARRLPSRHTDEQQQHQPDWLYEFFGSRRIGARTVNAFGCYVVQRTFQNLGDRPAIVFPYRFRGEVVNRKYRPYPEKNPQLQESNALPTLFNVDALGDAPEAIVWVEGEPDCLAMFECGITNVVSLKDGASASAGGDKRFEALRTHSDVLEKAKRMLLAGDMDAPGRTLREELARRLGRHRCFIVEWPDGCKDASDVLRDHGPDAVTAAVRDAQPYPIEGLQRIKIGTLLGLRHGTPPPLLTTGALTTDRILKLPGEGRLIIVTGIPNHGKSSWVMFVQVHLMAEHDRRFLVFSPEMQPWENYTSLCAQIWCGKPFWPRVGLESMTDGEIVRAEVWLRDRMVLLVSDAEDEPPTLDWIIEGARAAVLRDGVTDLLIDPWNEIEHQAGDMTETQYVGRALQRLRAFAFRHGCNVWIVAHPTKLHPAKPGESLSAPGLYDISGGANWANKADLGITVHTPAEVTEIHLTKPRYSRWGRRGTKAELEFDGLTGRYRTPLPNMAESRAQSSAPDPWWTDAASDTADRSAQGASGGML